MKKQLYARSETSRTTPGVNRSDWQRRLRQPSANGLLPRHWETVRPAPLPIGYVGTACPQCGGRKIAGAIVMLSDGSQASPSADELDPNIVCMALDCRAWFG